MKTKAVTLLTFFSICLIKVSFLSAGSLEELQDSVSSYFAIDLSEDSISRDLKVLRAQGDKIGASVFSGNRQLILEKISELPQMAAGEFLRKDSGDAKEVLRFMILDNSVQNQLRVFNDNLRKEKRNWKIGTALAFAGLGTLAGAIIFKRLDGPDWQGFKALILGAGVGIATTSAGLMASDAVIDRIAHFRSLDGESFRFDIVESALQGKGWEFPSSTSIITSFLAGELSLGEVSKSLLGDTDDEIGNFLEKWPSLLKEMETYIKSLSDEQKLVAIVRALEFQSMVGERIESYNWSQRDSRFLKKIIGAASGAALGMGICAVKGVGKEAFVMVVVGLGGAALGYYSVPFVWNALDGKDEHLGAKDFSVLDLDLILE
ncbi:MAG: hypothetical protein COV44_11370 [Deltaproteobacteria bacterium CG11_big_fil_rev_8_21_14_0_20_45_16]|nr:MAG: hypothetical protein COV44_11370 [Deltaproteobacteria bacterium CG11_big_fil_rev_8_21_14_0_20_45_16]